MKKLVVLGVVVLTLLTLLLSGCTKEVISSFCEKPYEIIGGTCCLDLDNDDICDEVNAADKDVNAAEIECETPQILVNDECCWDFNENGVCDDQETPTDCWESQILVNGECCFDFDNDGICDGVDTGTQDNGSITPGAPLYGTYTTADTQPRDIVWRTQPTDSTPYFTWINPMNDQGIKGYWAQIDNTGWQLVPPPPTNTRWDVETPLADGTHEFKVKPEYSTQMYGLTNSMYFEINTNLPDFVVADIKWDAPYSELSAEAGTLYYAPNLRAVIRNDGGSFKKSAQLGSQWLRSPTLFINGKESYVDSTKAVDELGAGEEIELTFKNNYLLKTYLGREPGNYEIKVVVNQNKYVEETNYENNEKTVTLTVS